MTPPPLTRTRTRPRTHQWARGAAALLCAAATTWAGTARAGFVLQADAPSVLPGHSFTATLRYDGPDLDFGFDFLLSGSVPGMLRLDSLSAADGRIASVLANPAAPSATPWPGSQVSVVLNDTVPGAPDPATLLQMAFTLDSGATPGSTLDLLASNGLATIGFAFDVPWAASTRLLVATPTVGTVPEPGSLAMFLLALAACARQARVTRSATRTPP